MNFFLLLFLSLLSCFDCFSAVSFPALRYGHNFHTVEEGKCYRSGQLPNEVLGQCIDCYKIKMVINLRHRSEDSTSFDAEKKMCEEQKILFFNIPMQSHDLPSCEQIKSLLALYQLALLCNLIILIHCYAGIDRTGLSAALWVFQRQDCFCQVARKIALEQLTWKHGSNLPEPAKVFFIKIWQGESWLASDYSPEKYHLLCEKYVHDQSYYECFLCCCDCCCDCIYPPCFCTSRYWEERWKKRYLFDGLITEVQQMSMT